MIANSSTRAGWRPRYQVTRYVHRTRRFELVRHGFDQPEVELAGIGVLRHDNPLRRPGFGEREVPDLAAAMIHMIRRIEGGERLFDGVDPWSELGVARNAPPDLLERFGADLLGDIAESVQPRLLRIPRVRLGVGNGTQFEQPQSAFLESPHSVDRGENRLTVHHHLRGISLKLCH